jgi:serine protease inhibitor
VSAVDDVAIRACNNLTRRWVDQVRTDESFVLSGSGAWLVLAALARGATGDARPELENAVGMSAADVPERMSAVTTLLSATPGVASALGVWANLSVPIRDDFIEALPDVTIEALPRDVDLLDRWVRSQTREMISSFPAPVTPETLLVAASVVAAEADWVHPFDEGMGRWRGIGDWIPWLYHRTGDRSQAAIIESPHARVGRVVCATASGFDVHLVTGAIDADPASVLAAGLDALEGSATIVDGASLRRGDDAGCLTTRKVRSHGPELVVGLPGFEIDSSWDLTAHSACFGLTTATDSTRGHFGEISPEPLAIEAAGQRCVAGFSATGFRAAAATFAAIMAGGGLPETTHTVVSVNLDQPFGFLVVHRATSLALFAGWVQAPAEQTARSDAVIV